MQPAVVSPVCLDDGRVRAFVSAKLDAIARQQVEDHVDDCDDCRKLLVTLIRTAPPVTRWTPGDRVGRYLVGESVGRGAMGEVFRGDDTELGRPVALKRLHGATDRARLLREARAAAQLQHPNVVAVYEIVDDPAGAVLATEWIDGVTLRAWLTTPRHWREIVQVVLGAGRGLAAAHAAGIVHRDFKPENVLVDRRGRARVADFGLASGFDTVEAVGDRVNNNVRVTATGTLAGTPAYMAPELIDGAKPDARSDQFAFGITLYEAVYGKYPFAGATAEAIWAQMATGTIAKGERRVPVWLDRAIQRALSPDPKDRFATLDELLDRLDRKSRRGMGFPLAIAGAVGGIAVAGLLLAMPSASDEKCGDDLVDDVWSRSVRASYSKQFATVSPLRSVAALSFTDQTLEQWTGSWRLGRRAACAADPSVRRARTSCLDRQLGDLRAQLAVWTHADAGVVDRSLAAAAALPSPTDCTTATSSTSSKLAEQTAELDAMRRAGKFHDARPKLAPLAEAAARETDPAGKARALFAIAAIEYELRDHAAARAHLATAAQVAKGDDFLLANILIMDASVHIVANKPAEALGVLSAIEALSPTGVTAARLESVRGEALNSLGRAEDAVAAYQKAVDLLEKLVARDPSHKLALAANIGAKGSAMGRAGKPEEGIAELLRALAIEEPLLGPTHPEVGRTLFDLGYLYVMLNRNDEAIAGYNRVRKIFIDAMGEGALEVAATDAAMADIAISVGDFERGFELASRARDEYLRSNASPALLSSIETGLGNIEQNRERCGAAIPHYERALAAAHEAGQKGPDLAISYSNLASCLVDVGKRDAEARNALEGALAAWKDAGGDRPERAHAMATLADLEARAGRYAKAIELGQQSIAALNGLEGEPWQAIRDHVNDAMKLWRRGKHE